MRPRNPPSRNDRGAALATVLVMTAVMSGLAIIVVEAARFSLQRTANQVEMDHTRWNTTSGEVARWVGQPLSLPLDNGMMQITVRDGGNCFNLNSLATQGEGGPLIVNEAGRIRFALLLKALNVQNGLQLADAVSDWIDTDAMPALAGAEDEAYGGDGAIYLPPNSLMGDTSELRAIKGFSADVLARIAPSVCTRPTAAPNALNVNTLLVEQAPLLAAIFGAGLPLAQAERVIAERPAQGWADVDTFLRDPRLAGVELSAETRALFATMPRWYIIAIRVQNMRASESSVALVDVASGHPRIVRRVFGASPVGGLL